MNSGVRTLGEHIDTIRSSQDYGWDGYNINENISDAAQVCLDLRCLVSDRERRLALLSGDHGCENSNSNDDVQVWIRASLVPTGWCARCCLCRRWLSDLPVCDSR